MGISMTLDLENPAPFWDIIHEAVDSSSKILSTCRDDVHLVYSISACGNLPAELEEALNSFTRAAKEKVNAVSAYHGCRVFRESDYTDRGIRKLETSRIVSWSKCFFGNGRRIDEILAELGRDYIDHGESAVYCMRGIEAANRNGCSHCDGSELIRSIARRLGPAEEERYFSVGRPCYIEICVPIRWFELNAKPSIECLLRDIFVHWLWVELNLDGPGDPREGGIVFGKDIPPEYVKTFHYKTGPNQPLQRTATSRRL